MKITAITSQKKKPGRVNIFVDDEFAVGLPDKLLLDYDLYKGKELTDADLVKIKSGSSASKCLDKAYRFLSFRARSEKEMRDKLTEKFEVDTVDTAIKRLKKLNLVNDAEFASAWINSRKSGRSKKALAFELKLKGVSKEVTDEALTSIEPEVELAAALELVKKHSKYQGLDRNELYKKVAPFLARRGYNYDIIKKVIDNQ